MRQLGMSITWLGLICLMMVEATEGSVGQNIQYPQVRVLYKCKDTLSSPEYLFKLLLTFTNTKAYFSALPPLWALFVLFPPNSGQIISLLARDAFGFSGVLPVPRVPRQNPSKSSQATVSSNPGDPSMLLIFSSAPQTKYCRRSSALVPPQEEGQEAKSKPWTTCAATSTRGTSLSIPSDRASLASPTRLS